jgi:hypothetical protein
VRGGAGGLLEQPVEQQPPSSGGAPVEPEGELVEVVGASAPHVSPDHQGRAAYLTGSSTTPLRRRRGMTEEAAVAAVDQACQALRLPSIRAKADDLIGAAEREQLSYRGFLAELLLIECDDRARRRSARRVKAAGFPRDKWLGDFDFEANPNLNPATIHQLATSTWVKEGQPLCLIGDSGTE